MNTGLTPKTVFGNVGYGLIPSFKRGPPQLALPPGRMLATPRLDHSRRGPCLSIVRDDGADLRLSSRSRVATAWARSRPMHAAEFDEGGLRRAA